MKRIGPELKMPDLEVPPVLADLFHDLRKRGLLPVVGLVLVAIVAVPLLLGNHSAEEEAEPVVPQAAVATPSATSSSHLAVVEAKPGLRDYHKRLGHRKPTDPFKQRFTAPVVNGSPATVRTGGSSSTTVSTTEGPSGSGESPAEGAPSTPPSSGGGEVAVTHHLTFYTIAIDAKITKAGGGKDGNASKQPESSIKHEVPPLTALPGDKAPVVTYMGPSQKGKPVLLVSTDVRSEFGEAICLSGSEVCQLLELELGMPETFVYGANETRYTINVLKIEKVVVGHKWPGLDESSGK
jgi:hypothetical protein